MPTIDINESLKRCCDALKNCQCEPGQEYQEQQIKNVQDQRQHQERETIQKVTPVPLLSDMQKHKLS